ncbi:MAG TPA: hypothetical protein VGD88_08950 [Opitutaceae bacterium]
MIVDRAGGGGVSLTLLIHPCFSWLWQLRQIGTTLLLLASFLLAVSARGESWPQQPRDYALPLAAEQAGFHVVVGGEQPVPCIEALFALPVSVELAVNLPPRRECVTLVDAGRSGSSTFWFYPLYSRPPPVV